MLQAEPALNRLAMAQDFNPEYSPALPIYMEPQNHRSDEVLTINPNPAKETEKGFFEKLLLDANYRNIAISVINALFHGAATVTSFAQGSTLQKANKFFNSTAFFFTKWLAPLSSYATAAIASLYNGKFIEGLIKLIPPVFLPLVGDANIDTVYGMTNCLNQPFDMAHKRLQDKGKLDPVFKERYENNRSAKANIQLVWSEIKSLFRDFKNGSLDKKQRVYFYNIPLIFAGSLPILAFARKDRDSWLARITGLLRSAGGIMGDYAFIVHEDDPRKKLVGVFCGLAACCDLAKRWVSEGPGRILIHLGAALNVAGMAMWNAFSGKEDK